MGNSRKSHYSNKNEIYGRDNLYEKKISLDKHSVRPYALQLA